MNRRLSTSRRVGRGSRLPGLDPPGSDDRITQPGRRTRALLLVAAAWCSLSCAWRSFSPLSPRVRCVVPAPIPLPAPKIIASARSILAAVTRRPTWWMATRRRSSPRTVGHKHVCRIRFRRTGAHRRFQHQDRNDLAPSLPRTDLQRRAGKPVTTVSVPHVNRRGGLTSCVARNDHGAACALAVARLGSQHGTVGGATSCFWPRASRSRCRAASASRRARCRRLTARRVLRAALILTLEYPYAKPAEVVVRIEGQHRGR